MKCIEFNFHKGKIRYSVLNKKNSEIEFVEHHKTIIDTQLALPCLMDRYRSNFIEIIKSEKPDLVACRQVYESGNLDSANFQILPVGILALECGRQTPALEFVQYSPPALRSGGPFGVDKKLKPIEIIDDIFGKHPPNWDVQAKWSTVVAWRALRESQ